METLKEKIIQYKIHIIAFFLILFICIVGYNLSHGKRVNKKLNFIDTYLKNRKSYALDFCSEKYRGYPLLDYHICSSANSIASNLIKYDHYSAKMIESAIRYGARFIELEIHNKTLELETVPIISIGTERGKWKEGLNVLTLDEVFSVIRKKAFNEELIANYTDPFFIFFNLKTNNNTNTLDILYDKIIKYFGSKLLDRRYRNQRLDISNTSVCDLVNKIVILSSDGYEDSKFESLINLSTNSPKLTRITFSELDKKEKFDLKKPQVVIKSEKIEFRDGYLDKYDFIQINDYTIDLKEMGVKAGQLIKIDGALNPQNNSDDNNDLFKIKQVTRNKILLTLKGDDKLIPEKTNNKISLRIYDDVKEKMDIEKLTKQGLFIVVPDSDIFSSNFASKTAWFAGAQFVALNFHNPDEYLLQYLNFFDNASIKLKIPGIRAGKKKIQEDTEDLSTKYPAPAIENLYGIDENFLVNFMDRDVQITPAKNTDLRITMPKEGKTDLMISPVHNFNNSSFFIQEPNNNRVNSFSIRIPGKNKFLSIKENQFLTFMEKPKPIDTLSSESQIKEMEEFKETTSFMPLKPKCAKDGFVSLGIIYNEISNGVQVEKFNYLTSNPNFNPKNKVYTGLTNQARIVAQFINGATMCYVLRPIGEKGLFSLGDILISNNFNGKSMVDDKNFSFAGDFIESKKGFKVYGGAVEPPVDYDLIWTGVVDTTTDTKDTYSIWKPIAPMGFTCPGYIIHKRNLKPNKDQIMCIKDEFLETSTQPPPGRRLLYELAWDNQNYSKENKVKGLTLWIPNVLESERRIEYFVPFGMFDNKLFYTNDNNAANQAEGDILNIEKQKDFNIITEYEYPFVAPNDFDFPQYLLADTDLFILDKLSVKTILSGKEEKLNSCFKFSRLFENEPENELDMNLLNNLGKIDDDIGNIKNYARNEFGGKMCLSLDSSYWSQMYENKYLSVDDYSDKLGDPKKNKIFSKKCGDIGHFGSSWVYNKYDKSIRLSGNSDFCLTSDYKDGEPVIDEQLYLKQCNTNEPGQEYLLKENGNIQAFNGAEKDACLFANANNIVKLSKCSERLRKKFAFDSLPATFCIGEGKTVYVLYKAKRERNLKSKLSVIPEVVDNPLDELLDFNFFHVYIRGRVIKNYDEENFVVRLGLNDENDFITDFQILNNDGLDYKIVKSLDINRENVFEVIIRKDSNSLILDPSPNPLVSGEMKLNISSNVLCENGQLTSDFISIPSTICKFKAKVVKSVGENQYQVVFSINGSEYDKKNKNHFRPRKVLAKTFKSKDITIIQKAPLCKY